MSPHWAGIRVAARAGRGQAKIPGRPRTEVSRLPQWGGILVAGGGSTEVAAGGKGRCRLKMMVPSQVVRGDRYPGGCREEEGGIQVAIRMAVSRSPQNGGLQIAVEWRSPGRRRMEVSRSPQDGGLQVAA